MTDYVRGGGEIYRRSFAIIRREADLSRVAAGAPEKLAVRIIHASGMVDIVDDLMFSPDAGEAGRRAIAGGATILCDSRMVAEGVTRARLPAANRVICTLNDPQVPALAQELGNTRTAAALELWRPDLAGAVVAIGNAPTALFRLLELLDAGAPKPALILGFPVGFVGAAESKAGAGREQPRRAVRRAAGPARRQRDGGRRAQRARDGDRVMAGKLIGLASGPAIPNSSPSRRCACCARRRWSPTWSPRAKKGNAFSIIEEHLQPAQEIIPLVFPVTTEWLEPPLSYESVIAEFYDEAAITVAAHLDAGRDVAMICEGDPFFYGSFMYLHDRLAKRYATEVVPGVCSIVACAAALGAPPRLPEPTSRDPVGRAARGRAGETPRPGRRRGDHEAGHQFREGASRRAAARPWRARTLYRACDHGRPAHGAAGRDRPGLGAVFLHDRDSRQEVGGREAAGDRHSRRRQPGGGAARAGGTARRAHPRPDRPRAGRRHRL